MSPLRRDQGEEFEEMKRNMMEVNNLNNDLIDQRVPLINVNW